MKIVITGASSGLGEEIAYRYASSDNHLVLMARNSDRLEQVANRCRDLGAMVDVVIVDVSDFAHLQSVAKEIDGVDMAILNAGVSLGHESDGVTPFGDFKSVIDINFLSLHALLEPLLPQMMERKSGTIVFISSLASLFTMPTSIAYSSSKRAINAYAEGLSYQLARYNIDVINIAPGFIDSQMTRKNRFNMPFLLSTSDGVDRILQAIEDKKRFYTFPFRFALIIKIISLFPYRLREKIVNYLNFKKG